MSNQTSVASTVVTGTSIVHTETLVSMVESALRLANLSLEVLPVEQLASLSPLLQKTSSALHAAFQKIDDEMPELEEVEASSDDEFPYDYKVVAASGSKHLFNNSPLNCPNLHFQTSCHQTDHCRLR